MKKYIFRSGVIMINKIRKLAEKYRGENKELISNILKFDDAFLNMDIETSYSILRELGVPEKDIEKVFIELVRNEE
jgi:hypothetical protein